MHVRAYMQYIRFLKSLSKPNTITQNKTHNLTWNNSVPEQMASTQ